MSIDESQNKNRLKKTIILLILALFALLLGTSGFFYYQYQMLRTQFQNSPLAAQKAAQEETKKLVTEISRFMILPKDETPTLFTVTDVRKLKNQLFFRQAENGDKGLIFTKEKLAILYDPKVQKIVNVGPINTDDHSNQASQAKIVLRNGTNTSNLTKKAEKELQKKFPSIDIEKKEQATKSTYTKTIVVILNSNAKNAAVALAQFYNVSLSALPIQEKKLEGMDILVILGEDQIGKLTATQSASKD